MARKSRIAEYESLGRTEDDDDDFDVPDRQAWRAKSRRVPAEILLDEPRFVVVSKPAGVPSIPERFRPNEPTIIDLTHELLRRKDPAAPRPVICHRLDLDTSGVMVLAKDPEAAKDLMAQFEAREVKKSYLALTTGAPQPPAGHVEFHAGQDPKKAGAMQIVTRGGRECASDYETVETWRGISLVRVRPLSGRTHQVRLTLLQLGTPCAIDPLYGSTAPLLLSAWKRGYRIAKEQTEAPLIDRLTLHAETIEFRRPGATAGDANGVVRVEAPLPRDFHTAVRQIRRWGAAGTL